MVVTSGFGAHFLVWGGKIPPQTNEDAPNRERKTGEAARGRDGPGVLTPREWV